MLLVNHFLLLSFSVAVMAYGPDCGEGQTKYFTGKVLDAHDSIRKANNLDELKYSCYLSGLAKEAVVRCSSAVPSGYEKHVTVDDAELEETVSAPTLAFRILNYWKNREEKRRNMLRPEVKSVGCAVEVCKKSDKMNIVNMACYYGNSDGKLIVEEKPVECGGIKLETINFILGRHNKLRQNNEQNALKWNCDLENKANAAIKECPVSLQDEEANFARLEAPVPVQPLTATNRLLRSLVKQKQKVEKADISTIGCSMLQCPESNGKHPAVMACFYGN